MKNSSKISTGQTTQTKFRSRQEITYPLGLPFCFWRRRSSITELRLCAFVAPCQETKLLNQLANLFLAGSLACMDPVIGRVCKYALMLPAIYDNLALLEGIAMSKKKVLCFDDDEDLLMVLQTILTQSGMEVELQDKAENFIEKIVAFRPDAIILDVMFAKEKIDGFEVCRNIRKDQRYEKLPIIMLTAINQFYPCDFEPHPEYLPCNYFLEKPIDPDKLVAILRQAFTQNPVLHD